MPTPIGGGGGGLDPGFLSVSPSGTLAYGNVANGSTTDILITVSNDGGIALQVKTVTVGGAPYSLVGLPTFPKLLAPGAFFTFTLRFSPVGAATYNDTLNITTGTGVDNSPYSAAISGTVPGAGGSLLVSPSIIPFNDTISTHTATPIVVQIKSIGSVAITLNSVALNVGLPFGITGLPGLPLVMNPGDSFTFNVTFNPLSVANFTDLITVTTAIGSNTYVVQGSGVALIPVAIIGNNLRQLIFSFITSLGVVSNEQLDPTNLNGLQAGVMIFNGSIWDQPGQEKALRRIQIWYENYGVASLTCTVTVFRPSIGSDSFDTKTQTISIGTVAADLSERSTFFDIQVAGEIIILQFSRSASGGPISLIGYLPQFEDKGGKIENL